MSAESFRVAWRKRQQGLIRPSMEKDGVGDRLVFSLEVGDHGPDSGFRKSSIEAGVCNEPIGSNQSGLAAAD